MNEEEFLLKWNNHQTNFVDVFNHLLKDDSFVDVTLVCGGEAVLGHKMVLAACSPLLHRILRDNPCKHPVLILSDVPAGDMRAMMKFIYQGEVSVSQSELASFLKTADNLQIKGLAEDKEKDRDHRSKEERKRKDKDDRAEGRSGNKRQRLADSRATEACSPLLTGSLKTVGDSHSSHKSRSNKAFSDEHSPKGVGGGGVGGGSLIHAPVSKHVSSKTSSSKIVVHGISNKVLNTCTSKENSLLQANSNINIGDHCLLKPERSEDLTIKTEPLDYPGEMVWTEGHGAINSDLLDDPQPLIPLGAIPGTLEGVAVALATSPNLPILETNDDGRCDDESRGDMSTASDDINANTTTGGTWVPGIVAPNGARDTGIMPPDALALPPPQPPPLPPPQPALLSPMAPLPTATQLKEEVQDLQIQPANYPISIAPSIAIPLPPILPASSGCLPVTLSPNSSSTTVTTSNSGGSNVSINVNNNSVHKCQQCPFVTLNPYTFTRHLRIHLGTKEFRCRVCAFASSRKDSLIRHFRMKHLTGEMSVYHDLESRDIEELALARGAPDELRQFR